MKLTWGCLFWPSQTDAPRFPPPGSDLSCDVLIVGAGITGALIADALTREGLDVIAVDKREPGCGSTGASTSLLLYDLDTPLHELAGLIGQSPAERVYRMGIDAIDRLADLTSSLGEDCGFRRRKCIYLASNDAAMAGLKQEYAARQRAGLRVDLLSHDDLASMFHFDKSGAILSEDAAELDPFKLTQVLLKSSVTRGLRLFGHCEIKATRLLEDGICAVTSAGPTIVARQIIYATGYEAASLIGGDLAKIQVTYAAVSETTQGMADWWERCLIWETARPYLYLRTTPDGRAMIGGLDDDKLRFINDADHLQHKSEQLRRKFGRLFPNIPFEIDAAWAGIFETTADGMPYIGRHARFPRALFALGYGGNGLTFGVMAAEILRDLCVGRTNPNTDLFAFSRPTARPGGHGGKSS